PYGGSVSVKWCTEDWGDSDHQSSMVFLITMVDEEGAILPLEMQPTELTGLLPGWTFLPAATVASVGYETTIPNAGIIIFAANEGGEVGPTPVDLVTTLGALYPGTDEVVEMDVTVEHNVLTLDTML